MKGIQRRYEPVPAALSESGLFADLFEEQLTSKDIVCGKSKINVPGYLDLRVNRGRSTAEILLSGATGYGQSTAM